MEEEFNKNIALLSDIAVGDETNPLVIETVFQDIFKNIEVILPIYAKKFWIWLGRYFCFFGKSFLYLNYSGEEFTEYRRNILICLRNSLQQKKYLNQLRKEFLKCQNEELYSQLPHLYLIFFQFVCAIDIREYYLAETGNILSYAAKSITYLPKKEIVNPFVYDEIIKESMLDLKKV